LKKRILTSLLAISIALSVLSVPALAAGEYYLTADRIYVTSTSHWDTVWDWPLEYTIETLHPATLYENFALFEKYPDYKFNLEGARRYQLVEEYYPEENEILKDYMKSGNWNFGGSGWENGDVNTPSPEALFRNFLYGNNYIEDNYGQRSKDIFLPDCFGFGYALPSIAAHSNIIGFATAKLAQQGANMSDMPWGTGTSTGGTGRWYGPDGNFVIANINVNWPGTAQNVRTNSSWNNRLNNNKSKGYNAVNVWFGTGDSGGSADPYSVGRVLLEQSQNTPTNVNVINATTDQAYKDMTQAEIDALPSHDGELLISVHGAGTYTSQAIGKRWNRRAEMLGDAAERAASASMWLGKSDYPLVALTTAWLGVISHQFHDDTTGTSTSYVYDRSRNEYMVAIKQFAAEYAGGVGGVASMMNTSVTQGVPVVVNNPTSYARKDVVQATVTMNAPTPAVRVYAADGTEVPSQIISQDGNEFEVAFIADVKSVGYRTYNVRPSAAPCSLASGLTVTESALSNDKYTVTIDDNGNISSIFDKQLSKELLNNPIRLGLINEGGTSMWSAWEIRLADYWNVTPQGYVSGTPAISVVEDGPARVALKIDRTFRNSSYSQIVSLASGGAVVRVDNVVNWNERSTLLKAVFDLTSANPRATFDLGLGVVERGNSTSNRAEVPHQKWANLKATDGSYGVSIINDSKYGIDKFSNSVLRLSLIHSPPSVGGATTGYGANLPGTGEFTHSKVLIPSDQMFQDVGENRFAYAIYAHGDSIDGDLTQAEAEAFNQPMNAFQTVSHIGTLGDDYSFASIPGADNIIIRAIKKAERSDEIIVRVNETKGKALTAATLSMGNGIASAREVYASEEPIGPATVSGGALQFELGKYGIKTFALTLNPPQTPAQKNASLAVTLPYNADVFSSNNNKSDGAMTMMGDAYPTELVPDKISSGGVEYVMGPKDDGSNNAVELKGQTITLPTSANMPTTQRVLNLLAVSARGDVAATFNFGGGNTQTVEIGDYSENVAAWDMYGLGYKGYVKKQTPAFMATHRHTDGKDNVAASTYMFSYALDVPETATGVTLPNLEDVYILAATLVDNPAKLTPASQLYDQRERNDNDVFNIFKGFTGFEPEDPDMFYSLNAGTSNTATSINTAGRIFEPSTEKPFSGTQSLKFAGSTATTGTTAARIYFDLTTKRMQIKPGMVLTYKFFATNELSRYIAFDAVIYDSDNHGFVGGLARGGTEFANGTLLRNKPLTVDQDGVRYNPQYPRGVVGEWVTVTVDLYDVAPEGNLRCLSVGFDKPAGVAGGDFLAYIDDVAISIPQAPSGSNALQWNIDYAKTFDRAKYSGKSLANLDHAIELAETIIAAPNASQNELNFALSNLNKYMYDKLEKNLDVFDYVDANSWNGVRDVTFSGATPRKQNGYMDQLATTAWVIYRGVAFGKGASQITIDYQSANSGTASDGVIEVRLNHSGGKLLGTVPVARTNGVRTQVTAPIDFISGDQDICLQFIGNATVVSRLYGFYVTPDWGITPSFTSNGAPVTSIDAAAGNKLDATVTVANNPLNPTTDAMLLIALYDKVGRLISTSNDTKTIAPGASSVYNLSVNVPADTEGVKCALFLWEGGTYIPLTEKLQVLD